MTPGPAGSAPDFERLERVVTALVERHRDALRANTNLRGMLADCEQRLRLADGQILDLNQRRQDVAKRIDDLVAQILLLENQLAAAPE